MAKFCPNCGNELDDNAVLCPQCGTTFQNNNQISFTEKKSNGMAVAGFILSFFFALLGLIFSIIGLKKSKETNSGKGLSIAGIIISSINMIIGLIIVFSTAVTVPTVINTMDETRQKLYCPTAYSCRINTEGKYDCKYTDSEGKVHDITCDAKYIINTNYNE